MPYVFERFYQSKQADQKLYGGIGIDLALVNDFAKIMNGKRIESKNEDAEIIETATLDDIRNRNSHIHYSCYVQSWFQSSQYLFQIIKKTIWEKS